MVMTNDERTTQLAALRRLWLHIEAGGKLTEDDDRRWGFKLTKKSLEKCIAELEEQEWKNVG